VMTTRVRRGARNTLSASSQTSTIHRTRYEARAKDIGHGRAYVGSGSTPLSDFGPRAFSLALRYFCSRCASSTRHRKMVARQVDRSWASSESVKRTHTSGSGKFPRATKKDRLWP